MEGFVVVGPREDVIKFTGVILSNLKFKILILFFIYTFGAQQIVILYAAENSYAEIQVEELKITNLPRTILDQPITYPQSEELILKTVLITIPANKSTSIHLHRGPLIAYITAGILQIDYGSKGIKQFSKGDSYIEALDWCHQGSVIGDEPVQIYAIYLGSSHQDLITPENCSDFE